MRKGAIALALTAALLVGAQPSWALSSAAVTSDNKLITFQTATPGTITTGPVAIGGLQPGESIVALDVRPRSSELYALGSSSRLYTINPSTALATQVGSAGAFTLTGTSYGLDANPTADRLRAVSDAEKNLRVNPADGTLASTDTNLAYAAGDPNQGQDPGVVGSAYTNSYEGASTTTLYALDSSLDLLLIQNPPNSGVLNTVGALGFDTDGRVGFDIAAGTNIAYASMTAPTGSTSSLFTINLSTGAATLVGQIGPGGYAIGALALGVAPLPQPPPSAAPAVPAPTGSSPDTTVPTALVVLPTGPKISTLLKRGLVLEFSCDEACTAAASLTGGGSSRASATTTVGQGTATLPKAGVGTIKVSLTKSGKRYLKKRRRASAKRVRLSLATTFSDSAGNKRTIKKKLTLNR